MDADIVFDMMIIANKEGTMKTPARVYFGVSLVSLFGVMRSKPEGMCVEVDAKQHE